MVFHCHVKFLEGIGYFDLWLFVDDIFILLLGKFGIMYLLELTIQVAQNQLYRLVKRDLGL